MDAVVRQGKKVIEVSAKEQEFLSNEAIEGESLANRLTRGGLPAEEALRYAVEIGSALNRAHQRGEVHGKLSPHAVLLTASGARLVRPAEGADLDALAYRSPEQVAGQPPDWRSDIFSYGTLLYEMVSGRRAFGGEGAALSQAIAEKPPATLMGKSPIHAAMEGVIAGCMEKDPARRRQRVQNAVIELRLTGRSLARMPQAPRPRQRPQQAPVSTAPAVPLPIGATVEADETDIRPKRPRIFSPVRFPDEIQAVPGKSRLQRVMLWALLGVSLLLALSGAWILWQVAHPAPVQVVKFPVVPPDDMSYRMPAVSPDGKYIAVQSEGSDGKPMLWIRPLDALKPTAIPGTEGGFAPFWSPDSQYLGFFADKMLKKVRVSDGRTDKISDAEALPGGGTWNRNGMIVFAPSQGGPLFQVSANGGKPRQLTKLNAGRLEHAHLWPQFLPDGSHFVFFDLSDSMDARGVYTASLDAPEGTLLFQSDTNAVYSPPAPAQSGKHGYLVYLHESSLMGVGFNAAKLKLTGDPIQLQEDVGSVQSLSLAPISISDNAILVFQNVGKAVRQVTWTDRSGKPLAQVNEGGAWGALRISPDGTRAIVAKASKDGRTSDLWMVDQSGNAVQFTSGPATKGSPVWSPDGSRIAYYSNSVNDNEIAVSPVSAGAKVESLYRSAEAKYPTDWSRDGKYLFFGLSTEGSKSDVWALSTADRHAGPMLDTIYNEGYAALSPDGKWVAFQSDDRGRNMVYVEPFGGTKRRYTVSTEAGGAVPRWRADGKELYYMTSSGRMMAVAVHPQGGEFQNEAPQFLFQTRPTPNTYNFFDVAPDGQRFLMNLPLEWPGSSTITVETNWTEKVN
jgi:Tol biopolymer transport system component